MAPHLLFVVPFAASAQNAPATDEEINEEIIVTAQKRATSLQEVPFSVAAVTGDDIKQSGASNIVELARNIPGLYIADLGPGQSQVAIRGISAGQVVRDQPGVKESVGVYLDESPISITLFTPDLDLYDLDRVEVLRGPQGTLFGAGSSSGTVRYITAQPNIGQFGASVDLTVESATDGEIGGALRGSLNVPLGEKAAMRVVAYDQELAGFIDSLYPGRDTQEDVNGGSRTGGRLAFRFEPTENIVITPRIVYQKLETDGFPRIDYYNLLGNVYTTTEPAVDPGERGQVTQLTEGLTDEFMMGDLKLEFGFGSVGLTSVTTYIDRTVNVRARCEPAHRQRHQVADRPLRRRRAPQFAAVRRHRSAGIQPGTAVRVVGREPVPVGGGRVLPAGRSQLRTDTADPGLRRAHRRSELAVRRAAGHAVLFAPVVRLQPVRRVRRGHLPFQLRGGR